MESKKIDNNTIEITKTENKETKVNYDYDFLVNQKAMIIKDANDYLEKRKVEIDEIDAILAECDRLGIVSNLIKESII